MTGPLLLSTDDRQGIHAEDVSKLSMKETIAVGILCHFCNDIQTCSESTDFHGRYIYDMHI